MSESFARARSVRDFGQLGLGSANAGNLFAAMSDQDAHELFAAAWDAGVRHFDTAPHYGLGLAEERLGAFLQTKPREQFHLSTKVGRLLVPREDYAGETDPVGHFAAPAIRRRVIDYSTDGIRRSVEDSLTRLGLDWVDTIYVHDPEQHGADNTVPILQSAVPAVCQLRAEGMVSHAGVGTGSVQAARVAVGLGGLDLVMLAGRYTLLEQPAHPELLAECQEAGVGIVNTAPFNSGLLAVPDPGVGAHYEYGPVPPDTFQRAIRLAAVCRAHGTELPTAALHFGLQHSQVVAVVTGAATADQARETIARIQQPVPAALWEALRQEGLIP